MRIGTSGVQKLFHEFISLIRVSSLYYCFNKLFTNSLLNLHKKDSTRRSLRVKFRIYAGEINIRTRYPIGTPYKIAGYKFRSCRKGRSRYLSTGRSIDSKYILVWSQCSRVTQTDEDIGNSALAVPH